MKRKLTTRQLIMIASTLFGMFFGAGNLIFPVHLGQLAGSNVIPAIIGFIITAVGIPVLAVGAIGITHSDGLQELSTRAGKGFGIAFTCVLYLTIGPLFAIPRCATVSFTTGVTALLPSGINTTLPLLIFSFIFFVLVFIFSLKPGKIVIWIGQVINPIFLVFLAVLVITALVNPSASISSIQPTEAYESNSLLNGLVEGYNTLDAIAGLAFGIIVVNVVRRFGIKEDTDVAKGTLLAGIFSGLLMALIYVLTIIMGTQSRGILELSENGGIALAQIAEHYLGKAGAVILACTVTLACLKTSIGLVTSCSQAFEKITNGKIKYTAWAIIFTTFAFAISNIGLSNIISYSLPVLMLIYPLAIVLIILSYFERFFNKSKAIYLCSLLGALVGAILDFIKTLPFNIDMSFFSKVVPLFDYNLGWVVPAVIGFIIGFIIYKSKKSIK